MLYKSINKIKKVKKDKLRIYIIKSVWDTKEMCLLKVKYDDKNALIVLKNKISKIIDNDTIIICIGTDKCILDSLGPIVGKMLTDLRISNKVYGIIGTTRNALNINEKLEYIKIFIQNPKL